MSSINKNLGEKIKRYRISCKMTQADFAEKLGVTGASVSAYENGTRQPSFDVLVKIAGHMGATTDNLLGREKYGGRTLDVTYLTDPQLHMVEDIISTFTEYNAMQRLLTENESFRRQLDELLH